MRDEKDILGLRPVGRAIEKSVDGLGVFLGKICLPVAEEIGLYFQDHVKAWRARNAAEIGARAEAIINQQGGVGGRSVHPLLAWKIMENGSFAETDELHNAWAGLLASSCTEHPDDSNRVFIDILSQLTHLQVKIIEYACENAVVYVSSLGLIQARELKSDIQNILSICGSEDLHRVDRELDRLSALGMFSGLGGGFHPDIDEAHITPSPLCLQFYARCKGFVGSPVDFYDAEEI